MESFWLEEWDLSRVLGPAEGQEELRAYNAGTADSRQPGKHLLSELYPGSDDSGIHDEFDSWLEEATSIGGLETNLPVMEDLAPFIAKSDILGGPYTKSDLLGELSSVLETTESPVGSFEAQANFMLDVPKLQTELKLDVHDGVLMAPSSPVEMSSLNQLAKPEPVTVIKYVQPSTIDVSGLASSAQIVMDDLNVLHLPEPSGEEAALMLLQALADPVLASHLDMTEVESLLSSPPDSPVDTPPSSPEALVPDTQDAEYRPASRKRKSSSPGRARSLKTLKPTERRERKKLQNKNAATKYRIKKKAEEQDFKGEMTHLEAKNASLRGKVEDLSQEIRYMKDLLNETLKSKGLRIA